MLKSKEEKLFSHCKEELGLFIENPDEHDSSIERVVAMQNCFEVLLYKHALIEERLSKCQLQ